MGSISRIPCMTNKEICWEVIMSLLSNYALVEGRNLLSMCAYYNQPHPPNEHAYYFKFKVNSKADIFFCIFQV